MPPKALSLKKAQQKGPPKNQKPITQFFKTSTSADSQKPKPSADINIRNHHAMPSSKRKASSPIMIDEIDLDETVTVATRQLNTPKKIKTEVCNSSSLIKVAGLRTPNKENGVKMVLSPTKELERLHETSQSKRSPKRVYIKSPRKNKQELLPNQVNDEVSRSCCPLTPVDNIQETQNHVQTEEYEQKSCSLQALLSPSKSGSTVKVLDFGQDAVDLFGEQLDTTLSPGDKVSVVATRDAASQYCVGNSSGLLVLRPDHLISSTSVVAGVFCKRKAVLQERWKGIDSANTAALTSNITSVARLRREADVIVKESVQMLYSAGLSEEETRQSMQPTPKGKETWSGHVDEVLDIEENLSTVPEKKTSVRTLRVLVFFVQGHQISLERVDLREVSCGYPERRDLIILRNQLVQYLAQGPEDVDPESIEDIEDASVLLQQRLPEPVNHHNACAKCPYLTICSLHLWHTDGPSVSANHPLSKLRDEAMGHLTAKHIEYFLHWTALLKMEERGQMKPASGPQEGEFSIVSVQNRPWIAAGVSYATTVQNLTNLGVLMEDSERAERLRRLIIDKSAPEFEKKLPRDVGRLGTKLMRCLNIEQQRAVLKAVTAKDYALLQGLPGTGTKLPRDVGRLGTKLMRCLNIEQERAVLKAVTAKDYALLQGLPGTGTKLPRDVARLGTKLMRCLNIKQQRAVPKAVTAKDYALLQGLPGTGTATGF
ncbi:DNA2-like helicase [Operophtera brumata]|uniref:DNA2-like helicase n=1 Tax=Operophtera brumata TaxID=104452 RepID=A0A0L7LT65_OPEBR|nr:DNA2-like helicase [Operophtera brumata]